MLKINKKQVAGTFVTPLPITLKAVDENFAKAAQMAMEDIKKRDEIVAISPTHYLHGTGIDELSFDGLCILARVYSDNKIVFDALVEFIQKNRARELNEFKRSLFGGYNA